MIPHVAIGTPRSSGASALIECAGPLSPVQAAAWKNRTLDRRDGVDVVQVLGRLHEEIQPSRLENAWKAAVARHPGLRTALRWEGIPEPLQEVHRQATVCIEYEDWSAWPDTEDRAARIEDWLSADRAKGFDLQQPPLLRLKLFGFSTRDFLLVWTYHRILLDTRSVAAVIREVLGEQAAPGQAAEQPPSPAALFSRTEAEAYWRETLRGFPTPTPLMVDRAAGAAAEAPSNAGIHELTLSPSASRAVEDLAAREGASAGTVLRAAWALLLHRYSGEPDVLFGVQSERGKSIREGTAAVGNHTNTVPARLRIPNTASTSDFLRSVRDGENAARPFEDTPLTAIRRWSEIPSGAPLFDSQLLLEGPRLNAQLRAAGPEWLARDFQVQERHECALTMSCHLEREIALRVVHDRGRIDDAAARRVLGHFERLLRGMVEAPDGPVAELALLTDAEMEQLRSWNETGAALPQRRVTDLFEAQAARTPDRVAVAFELNSWSYRELNERANQIARHLARQGVQPGARVGILIEPEPLMVASLLGILKAGAAYVPLDPAFPAERLRFMMEDANLCALVTRQRFRARLPAGHAKAIDLDSDWTAIQTEDAANPAFPAPGDADAYLIYTSGSTGRPKGVPVAHSALANLLCAMRDEPGLAESDVLLAVTTISFDIAGLELFLPLIVGARLTLIGRGVAADPSALAHAIVEIRPTVMQATPSLWQMLLEAGWPGNPDMKILCGGEALSRKLANRLDEMSASLWNLYGPTETTIWSTAHRISPAQGPVPIGRPIANTSVHVLDSLARPLPVGIPGELYIGGAGVARGYWNRPDLSAERFVPSPLPDRPGELLYRTGDVARYLDDGSLEYVGRADHQVKIRGFRIELGEIEGALAQHPSVHQCIVLARDDEDDTRRLVAYLVVDRTREVRTDELRTFLAKTLPDYMIPSAFVFVDAYPMTPNGKIDRKALPRPGEDRRGLASAVGPVHESEQILVKIWESVLRTRPIGIHDNFFDLGGDSHLALRLFIRVEKLTGRRLPLATLLGAPTIATLAPHLSGDDPVSWRSLVMIQSGADRRPIFLVPGIGGNAVGYHALARHVGADQPVFGLQALGLDGKTEPLFRIEDMAAHYIREIKASGFRPPFHLAGASFGGLVAYEMARQLQADGVGVGVVALFDSYAPPSSPSILGTRLGAPALSQQWSRLRFHTRKLLMEPDWVNHLRGSTKTLARRVRSRLWQMAYRTYARRLARLPPYFRRVEEAGHLASRHYMPAPAPVRVELFRASIRAVDDTGDPDMGWARIATGGVKITNVPGDHLTMLGTPHVEVVGRALRKSLDEEDAARPSRPTAP